VSNTIIVRIARREDKRTRIVRLTHREADL
jgi:hypothetical protein